MYEEKNIQIKENIENDQETKENESITSGHNNQQNHPNNDITIEDLERQIKSDYFKSKEDLFEKLVELRNNGMINEIDNRKMRELLDLYDNIRQKTESPIDTQNYSSVSIENKNLIISQQNDRVLQTEKDSKAIEEEFKQEQNEMSIQSQNGLVNADSAFNNMTNKKIEMTLITLNEAILSENVSLENLNKIRFFITSGYTNPHSVRVDISKGVFYNVETSDIYEIRYNHEINEYEIYKNNQLEYTESSLKETKDREVEKNKPKKRVLEKEKPPFLNNAAFTKISFLILNAISISLLITMAILLNK